MTDGVREGVRDCDVCFPLGDGPGDLDGVRDEVVDRLGVCELLALVDGVREADVDGDEEALADALADADAVADGVVLAVMLEVAELEGVTDAETPVVSDGVTSAVGEGVGWLVTDDVAVWLGVVLGEAVKDGVDDKLGDGVALDDRVACAVGDGVPVACEVAVGVCVAGALGVAVGLSETLGVADADADVDAVDDGVGCGLDDTDTDGVCEAVTKQGSMSFTQMPCAHASMLHGIPSSQSSGA